MSIEFVRWPKDRAQLYRQEGYWLDQPLTRGLERQVSIRPEAIALICDERQYSYAEMDRLSSNLASRLEAMGLANGDTALVQLPNVAEFYLVLYALLKVGVVPVNALYSHRRMEMTGYATQIQPRLLIADRAHELFKDDHFLDELRTISPKLSSYLLLGELSTECSLSHWLDTPPAQPFVPHPTPADEVALFQLSGGSTGTPKLIPRTHNDYDYSLRTFADICGLSEHTRFLCALPAGHNYLMSSPGALGVFQAGGCVVMARHPEPMACFELIERHAIDIVSLVPPAAALWIQAVPSYRHALESLRLVQVGGANFAEALARQIPEAFGCQLQQVFGMAEGLVNCTRLDDDDETVFTTQGRPISAHDEIRIIDENGQEVGFNVTGMLATRGPYTFNGYYRSAAHNAQSFDDEGFYYSGDLVQRTPQGYLRVVGRVKDQINRGGEKIASEEIENLLVRHPAITHAALVAIPDSLMGEKSCAFLVAQPDMVSAPLLRRYLLDLGIAEYKLPDRFRFIEAMPLTAVGKIDKMQLRKQLSQKQAAPTH